MHKEVQVFYKSLRRQLPEFFNNVKVLEIGSYNVNGSLREFFLNSQWVGVDLVSGPGVDVVSSGHNYNSSELFDHVLSSECFEHNPFYFETFENMVKFTKPGGLVTFTCASYGRAEHGTSSTNINDSPGNITTDPNYYKNLGEADFKASFIEENFTFYSFFEDNIHCDLMFVGLKKAEHTNSINQKKWHEIESFITREIFRRHFEQINEEQINIIKQLMSINQIVNEIKTNNSKSLYSLAKKGLSKLLR